MKLYKVKKKNRKVGEFIYEKTIIKGYKYRIYPNEEQEIQMLHYLAV